MYKFDTFERTSRRNEYKTDKLSKMSSTAHNDKNKYNNNFFQ